MISGYHACKREYTKAPYRLQRNALVIKIRNVLCALCVQVSAITFHLNLIFFLRFCLFKPAFCSFASHFFSFSFFISPTPTPPHTPIPRIHTKKTHIPSPHIQSIPHTPQKEHFFFSTFSLARKKEHDWRMQAVSVCEELSRRMRIR